MSAIPLHSGDFSTTTKVKAKGLNDRWPSSDSTEGIMTPRSEREGLQMAPMQGDIRVVKDVVSSFHFSSIPLCIVNLDVICENGLAGGSDVIVVG